MTRFKQAFFFLLGLTLIFPTFASASTWPSPPPYLLMEYRALDEDISRKELATIGVRLYGYDYLLSLNEQDSSFSDVGGWASPYINIADYMGIMKGVGDNQFKPDQTVKYIELLTVLMRYLGYRDGIDFQKYPEDYYNKALEIGLANLYIPHDREINRQLAWNTLERLEAIPFQGEGGQSMDYSQGEENKRPKTRIRLDKLSFNTLIAASFSGQLLGLEDFSGYSIGLLSADGRLYKKENLTRSGKFSITGFDIDFLARSRGYKYEVYDDRGYLILEGRLSS